MPESPSFHDLIRQVRAGEQAAAAELVRRYEATVRRVIRFRLVDARLGAVLDSMDVCQSVLASFFVRAASGQFDLDRPDDLVQLLATMARNKLASQARKERCGRRDNRRVAAAGADVQQVVAPGPSPSEQVAAAELLQEARRRLTADERRLVEMRGQGRDWADIAAERGESPVVLRKRLSRALDRVTRELGLDEAANE
jgi:RNA polymerase sigma factor (sigma-70 family)